MTAPAIDSCTWLEEAYAAEVPCDTSIVGPPVADSYEHGPARWHVTLHPCLTGSDHDGDAGPVCQACLDYMQRDLADIAAGGPIQCAVCKTVHRDIRKLLKARKL